MNAKECINYKSWGIWKVVLCKYCIARRCPSRQFDYDMAGRRWSMKTKKDYVKKTKV